MATPLSPVLDCTEFVAAEGRYELLQDISLDQVLPHPVIPTHVSSVSVKYKDYFNSSNGSRAHGKQTSADSTLSVTNLDRLEERLRDFKLRDEKGAFENDEDDTPTESAGNRPRSSSHGGTLSRNFHGNLVDLPLYHDDSSAGGGYKSPRSGMMSPGLPLAALTPGPPPLKDSTASSRITDPFSQFGAPPPVPLHHPPPPHSFKSLSRASSHYSQAPDDSSNNSGSGSQSSFATGSSSAGFSSFFSSKRKKPKNNITKTNSTFVAKISTHDNLAKILANRVGEDVYLFWNTGRTFAWSDLGQKPNEPLSQISFSKAFPTSHDVNVLTRSCDHLDVIIGFSTGDIIWFDPLCNKYYRLNKQAIIKDSAVTMIKWLPGSENQFMAAFHDGSVLIMDKERDDNAFSAPIPTSDSTFHVTRPKHSKHNPIAHWQVCKKPITAFAFSPDLQHVAVVAMDGGLRIIDFQQGRLLDTFSAYFGALNCVCWSPDGKYILTGGQDDLVTIWSFKDQRIVARCQGHQSYVTGVAFDPWRCDERNYRFGSVGEDAKLLLWDFSVGALHKPKAAAMQRRGSNTTVSGTGATGSNSYKPGHGSKGSISSLRGIGGHSLFSGHPHSNTSSITQSPQSSLSATHHHPPHHHAAHATQPIIAEESSQELTAGGEAPSVGSSTRNGSVHNDSNHHHHHPQQQHQQQQSANTFSSKSGENASLGDGSSTTSSVHSATPASEHEGVQEAADMCSSNGVYKKPAHARTLPHLHLHKSLGAHQQEDHSHHNNNNGHPHAHDHGHGHGHGLSAFFRSVTHSLNPHEGVQIVRPPEPRSHVAMLQPLMAKGIHLEPLASITFREDALMTSDRRGHIKVWKRPPPLPHHP